MCKVYGAESRVYDVYGADAGCVGSEQILFLSLTLTGTGDMERSLSVVYHSRSDVSSQRRSWMTPFSAMGVEAAGCCEGARVTSEDPGNLQYSTETADAASTHIATRGSVPTHYHTRLRPHTLPHEAASTHIATRGSVPTHYHTRLRPHTLPHEAASTHIATRGSVPTHYHTRLRPHTLPHEAASTHIATQGSVPTHYHMRL
ncbi:unnamed protein product, partial [Ranitomeya imitator]